MKIVFLFLLAGLLCMNCTQPGSQQTALLEKKLETVLAPSSSFDSLLQEVRSLPPTDRIIVLLNPALCRINNQQAVAQQEPLLLEILPLTSKREKKRLLLRLLAIYQQQKHYQTIPNARSKALRRCEELIAHHSLSQEERWDVMEIKAQVLDEPRQQDLYITIWFELLNEHRQKGETARVAKDLCAIACYFNLFGDTEKSLATHQEAYQLAKKNDLTEQCKFSLIEVINLTAQLGRHQEMLSLCHQVGIDSLATYLPSIYNTLATSYHRLGKPDSARIYLQREINATTAPEETTSSNIRIARTFVEENNEDSATTYLQKAMTLLHQEAARANKKGKKTMLPGALLETYPAFATLLHRNGKTAQAAEAFALVEPLMEKSVKTLMLFERQIEALTHYTSFCQATGQYEKGFMLLLRRDSLQQLCTRIQEQRSGSNLVERFKMQELIYTIDRQKIEFAYSQRALVAISGTSIILLCSIGTLIYLYRKRKQQFSLLFTKNREIEQLRDAADLTIALDAPQAATTNSLSPIEELFHTVEKKVISEKLFLQKELSLEQLARELKTNRSYLSSCINTCSGSNFNQWINNYRIGYVLDRIHTAPNLLELANEAGFLSIDSFYRHFKRCTQMTTGQYLKTKL